MAAADLVEERPPLQDLENLEKLPEIGLALGGKASASFVIDFENDVSQNSNLQDAFIKYKKKRQKQIKKARRKKLSIRPTLSDPTRMWNLRMKFLDQCRLYFGVPYAKRYWTPEDEHYNSKLFLDCCGLVRRAMRDLKREFGFRIGPWNQAYMYDTLPGCVEREEDMKPGDLVFIKATYFNPKMKKQPHDITHVEVWLGDGVKTIGARWQKSVVKVFDSYRFEAKAYHSETYIFKSIDPWLMGRCKSYCKIHPWKSRAEKFKPSKRSIFNVQTNPQTTNKQQSNDSDSSDGISPGGQTQKHSATQNTTRPQEPRTPKQSGKKARNGKKSSKKSAKKATSSNNLKQDGQSQQKVSNQQQKQQQSQNSPRQFHNISEFVHRQREQKQQEFPVKDECNPRVQPLALEDNSNNEEEDDEVGSAGNEGVGDVGSAEESEEEDEEAAECEEEEDDKVDDQNNNAAPALKPSLPDIFSPGNGQDCPAEKQQSLPIVQAQSRMGSLHIGRAASQAVRPLSGHSLSDDDDISVLNLQQEPPSYSLFPPAKSAGLRTFCESRPSPSVVPPLVDVLSSLAIRPDYSLSDDQSQGSLRPKTSSRATPRAHHRQFLLVGTSATQFNRDSLLRSPRLDLKVKVSPRYDLKPRTAFQSSVSPRRSYQHQWSPADSTQQQVPREGNNNDNDNEDAQGGASFSDPSGLAPSRSQTAGNVGQGQAGGQRSVSRPGEKGSPPEGDRAPPVPRKVTVASGREPTFYIGGGNGTTLVEGILGDLGWKRITDKYNEYFKVKWVECKNAINYNAFKEGDQLVNHIPNGNLLTNKMGLLTSLQAYERLNSGLKRRETRLRLSEFMPETYRLDDPAERQAFMEAFQSNDIWICKPTGMNQGKGIYLVRDLDEFKVTLKERDERLQQNRRTSRTNMGRVIQKYIKHPMLLEGRKFDIRAYMLIGSTSPYLVLYHKGYVRLSLIDYDVQADSLTAHLTNQYIQKKDPTYQEEKESTAWSMDKFNDYVNEHVAPEKGLEENWVYRTLTSRMRQIMTYCFRAVKNRLHCKIGYFDLYGLDFMVDEDMKVYLIEVNVNPSLATNCEALKDVIPGVVRESIHLSLECYEKSRRGQPLMPLQALDNFVVLYNGCTRSQQRAATATPTVRQSESNHSRPTPLPRRNLQSPLRRQSLANKDKSKGQTVNADKGQSVPELKTTRMRGAMTPKPAIRGGLLPTSPTPALRGAVPLAGAAIASSVSMATSLSNQVKLKMTHNSGPDPRGSKVKEGQGESTVLGEGTEDQGEGRESTNQQTEGQGHVKVDLETPAEAAQGTQPRGHETPTKQIITNARQGKNKIESTEVVPAESRPKGSDSTARSRALLSNSRTALRVAKVSLNSMRKVSHRSPDRGN